MATTWARRLAVSTLLALSSCHFEWGGGTSERSVTVPGEDGVHVKAEQERAGTRARIELERTTRSISQRDEQIFYLRPKKLIEQELRLVVGDGGKKATIQLASHNAASGYKAHRLEVGPSGKRVAYGLDDDKWSVIYVLSPTLAARGEERAFNVLDWTQVPTFEADFVAIYQHSHHHGKHQLILEHFKSVHGDERAAEAIFDLLTLSWTHTEWPDQAGALGEDGQKRLRSKLRDAVSSGSTNARHYKEAWRLKVFDPNASDNAKVVTKGLKVLMGADHAFGGKAEALTALLRAQAKHNPQAASTLACQLVQMAKKKDAGYALQQGRPLRLAAADICR